MKNGKIEFYSRKDVVENYMEERYSGKSGNYVNQKELNMFMELVSKQKLVLDVACGLGRLEPVFKENKNKVIGLDSSKEMLKKCPYKKKILGIGEELPFKNNKFEVVVATRLLDHYKDITPFLKEFARVTKKGGHIIFETDRWSLKKISFNRKKGGKLYPISDRKVKKILDKLNLKLADKKSIFLLSPFMLIHLPYFIVKIIGLIEKISPDKLKFNVYWKVIK